MSTGDVQFEARLYLNEDIQVTCDQDDILIFSEGEDCVTLTRADLRTVLDFADECARFSQTCQEKNND